MSLKIELKSRKRIIVGDCVVTNSNQRVRLLVEGNAPILREKDIMTAEQANTPAKRIYLAVQLMYTARDPRLHHETYLLLMADLMQAAPSAWPHIVAVGAGLGALATLGRPRVALARVLTAIAALIVTAGIGVFHVGVESHWWTGPQECSGDPNFGRAGSLLEQLNTVIVVRCDEAAWRLFGVSLAGYNVLISAALACVALWGLRATLPARSGDKNASTRNARSV